MSQPAPLAALAATLNARPDQLKGLETLKPEQLETLRSGFLQAQKRQRTDMQQAIDGAMKYVPALLRGTILKILRG